MTWNPSTVAVGVTIQRRRYVCTNNVKYQTYIGPITTRRTSPINSSENITIVYPQRFETMIFLLKTYKIVWRYEFTVGSKSEIMQPFTHSLLSVLGVDGGFLRSDI